MLDSLGAPRGGGGGRPCACACAAGRGRLCLRDGERRSTCDSVQVLKEKKGVSRKTKDGLSSRKKRAIVSFFKGRHRRAARALESPCTPARCRPKSKRFRLKRPPNLLALSSCRSFVAQQHNSGTLVSFEKQGTTATKKNQTTLRQQAQ